MLAFAILAAFLGLLGPFLLHSFFVFGRARIRFRFIISAIRMIIAILPIRSIYPSSPPRLLVLGLDGGGGGESIDINHIATR